MQRGQREVAVARDVPGADAQAAQDHLVEDGTDVERAVDRGVLADHRHRAVDEVAAAAIPIRAGGGQAADRPLLGGLEHEPVLAGAHVRPARVDGIEGDHAAVEPGGLEAGGDLAEVGLEHLVAVEDHERLVAVDVADRVQRGAGGAALQRRHADHLGLGGQQADHVVGVVAAGLLPPPRGRGGAGGGGPRGGAAVLLLAHEEDGVRGAVDQRSEAVDDALDQRLAVDLDQVLRVLVTRDLEHAGVAGHQHDEPHAATLLSLSAAAMRRWMASSVTSSGPPTTSTFAPAAVAALMPFSLSSTTTVSSAVTPSEAIALMYISGSGLPRSTSSLETMTSRNWSRSERSIISSTVRRTELEATPSL